MATRVYGEISLQKDTDQWCILHCEPHIRARLKSIFPRISQTAQPPYYFKNTAQNALDLKWFMDRYPLEIPKKDKLFLLRKSNEAVENNNNLNAVYEMDFIPSIEATLNPGEAARPHQIQAAEIHNLSKRLLVADKVGLGKTLTALLTGFNSQHIPMAIVVKTSLQGQWEAQIKRFTNFTCHSITGTRPYKLPPAQIYLYRYSQLSGWSDFFAEGHFNSVVYDEIQELRTGTKSDKGSAAKILSENAIAKMGLSATPIHNYGSEIFNIMEFLDPLLLGNRYEFEREWVSGMGNGKTLKDPHALRSFLIDNHIFIRRTKSEVGQSDNAVNTQTVFLPYDNDAVVDHEQLAIQLAIATVTTEDPIAGNKIGFQLDMLMRQVTGIAKAKAVAEYVKIIVEQGEKVVLVGYHRAVYDIWMKEFKNIGFAMYTGSESQVEKKRSVERFINEECPIFILSLESAEGLDGLQQVASIILIAELPWSKQKVLQAIGRLDREGQTESSVDAVYLLTNYGSDPVILDIIGLKDSDSSALIDGPSGMDLQPLENNNDRIQAMAMHFLESRGINPKKLLAPAA
jgi:SNF2 family DNA or RNA helicase